MSLNKQRAKCDDGNPMMQELYISDSESEIARVSTSDANCSRIDAQPMLPPLSPLAWERLPDNMKLIVVKELTSWFRYTEAVRLLRLTKPQERAFRELYNDQLQKQIRFDEAIRADMEFRDHERERTRHYSGMSTATASPAASLMTSLPTTGMYSSIPPLELLTDYVTVQHMQMGQDYLVAVGFDRAWVDLGHWIGHRGSARFEIELDVGHHRRVCEVGSRSSSILQRQPPVWSAPALHPQRSNGWHNTNVARVNIPAEQSKQSQQRRRRGRPRINTHRPIVLDNVPNAAGRAANGLTSTGSFEVSEKENHKGPNVQLSIEPPGQHLLTPRQPPMAMFDENRNEVVNSCDTTPGRHSTPPKPLPDSDHNNEEDGEFELE